MIRPILLLSFIAAIGCSGSKSNDSEIAQALYSSGIDAAAVCGSEGIIGTTEKTFANGRCGIKNPVRVYAVGGISLSTPALMNCEGAKALEKWVNGALKPNAKDLNKQVTEITNFQSYACRTRNHQPGAKLSEHATGNAIDIGGFAFSDGSRATVLADYRGGKYGGFMQSLRRGACGPFGTVLGPGSDRFHNDHFHFDVADHRSGPYCR